MHSADFKEAFLHNRELPAHAGDARKGPTCGSTIKTVHSRLIARSPDLLQSKSLQSVGLHRDDGDRRSTDGCPGRDPNDLLSPEGASWTGKTVHSAQVEPAVVCDSPKVQLNLQQSYSSNEVRHALPPGSPGEDQRVARTVGCAMALTKTAEREEAASAQAVNRGHTHSQLHPNL